MGAPVKTPSGGAKGGTKRRRLLFGRHAPAPRALYGRYAYALIVASPRVASSLMRRVRSGATAIPSGCRWRLPSSRPPPRTSPAALTSAKAWWGPAIRRKVPVRGCRVSPEPLNRFSPVNVSGGLRAPGCAAQARSSSCRPRRRESPPNPSTVRCVCSCRGAAGIGCLGPRSSPRPHREHRDGDDEELEDGQLTEARPRQARLELGPESSLVLPAIARPPFATPGASPTREPPADPAPLSSPALAWSMTAQFYGPPS